MKRDLDFLKGGFKMKKQGKGNTLAVFMVLLAVIVVGGVIYFGVSQNVTTERIIGAGGCEVESYLSENATFNKYSKSSEVVPSYSYVMLDDSGNPTETPAKTLTLGSSGTKFEVGDNVRILASKSGYLDNTIDVEITKCGANDFTNYIAEGDAITIDILDDRLNEVTDSASGGATNLSDGGAETSVDFIIEVKGERDKETGQVLLTLEGNDTELDDITIKARTANAQVIDDDYTTDLTLFASEGTSPVAKFAYIVDSVNDGGSDEYLFTATAESGQTLGSGASTGFLYGNAYAGKYFVDTDGSITFGWEDADGTLKYEQKATDHDALFS